MQLTHKVEDLVPRRMQGVPGAVHPWEMLMRVHIDGNLPRNAMGEWEDCVTEWGCMSPV